MRAPPPALLSLQVLAAQAVLKSAEETGGGDGSPEADAVGVSGRGGTEGVDGTSAALDLSPVVALLRETPHFEKVPTSTHVPICVSRDALLI